MLIRPLTFNFADVTGHVCEHAPAFDRPSGASLSGRCDLIAGSDGLLEAIGHEVGLLLPIIDF